jgi:hypothetical protein
MSGGMTRQGFRSSQLLGIAAVCVVLSLVSMLMGYKTTSGVLGAIGFLFGIADIVLAAVKR